MSIRAHLHEAITRLQAHQIEEARLDAEILLAEACQLTRAQLLAHWDDPLDDEASDKFSDWLTSRIQHVPVAYILQRKSFYGLELMVDGRVLIPRPETELLVEQVLCWMEKHVHLTPSPSPSRRGENALSVIDVGTGSGAIALALAAHVPSSVSITATDVSLEALAVARANAEKHHLSQRIRFVHSDLFRNVNGRADLIVANLPYVSNAEWLELARDIADHEPHLALSGGADGLDVFRKFFAQAPDQLAPNGAILLEIGWKQGSTVHALARSAFPHARIEVKKDLAGLDRVVIVQT